MGIFILYSLYPSLETLYKIFQSSSGICTDTRTIAANNIFFALKGSNFDGNSYASEAIKKGCIAAIVDDTAIAGQNDKFIVVEDVLTTLQQLSNYHRNQLSCPVIAITGSNGKTTTKELMYAVLSKKFTTHATRGNFNNHLGVPLTLLSFPLDCEIAIVEMGANHVGEIHQLCEIADPDFGIITNIGKAHLEGFGGIEGVIKAKSELYRYVKKKEGKLFVNGNDPLLMKLSQEIDTIVYGTDDDFFCSGKLAAINPFLTLYLGSETKKETPIRSQLVGEYNFQNILAACCVGLYFDVSPKATADAIYEYAPSNNRSQVIKKGEITILLDAYNANPTSVTAAIENLEKMPGKKKTAILGDMKELGRSESEEHQKIVNHLSTHDFDVILIGKAYHNTNKPANYKSYLSIDEASKALVGSITEGIVLIKGSRNIKMERLIDYFD